MKKYKYTIGAILLSLTTGLFANPETYSYSDWRHSYNDTNSALKQLNTTQTDSSFSYTTLGIGIPLPIPFVVTPSLGIGYRNKFDKDSALDIVGVFLTAFVVSGVYADCAYLKYLNEKNYYLGGAMRFGFVFEENSILTVVVQPAICFGKENKTGFYQFNVRMIHFNSYGAYFLPTLTYEYGFKF